MTRVLLYSDEPILAKGLESVLRQIEGFELLPTSNSLASLMEQITQDAPDLVLMDLTAEITFAVLSDMKHAMSRSRIVLWVNSISTELAFQAMGLGVRGILRKTLPTELQVKCLQKVQAGELWFEKALTDSFLCARRVALTQREGQLVSLLSQGLKNKEIATTLMIYLKSAVTRPSSTLRLSMRASNSVTTPLPPTPRPDPPPGRLASGSISNRNA